MTDNVTVAIVTGSCTALVGISAIVVNTWWVRYSLEKLGERITELRGDFKDFQKEMREGLNAVNGHLSELDTEVGKLMDRNK